MSKNRVTGLYCEEKSDIVDEAGGRIVNGLYIAPEHERYFNMDRPPKPAAQQEADAEGDPDCLSDSGFAILKHFFF